MNFEQINMNYSPEIKIEISGKKEQLIDLEERRTSLGPKMTKEDLKNLEDFIETLKTEIIELENKLKLMKQNNAA